MNLASDSDLVPLAELRNIQKSFGGVHALRGVNFRIQPQSIVGIAGENGAGKSTLLKVLTGMHQPDSGEVLFGGEVQRGLTPKAARQAGVAYVAQELSLLGDLSVAENIALGRESRLGPFVDRKRVSSQARAALKLVGSDVHPDTMVRDLVFADRQMVEIAKAMAGSPKILVLDEPTSGLRQLEVDRLLQLMRELRDRGCSSVFITHRMDEFFAVCDCITIMRDGQSVGDRETSTLTVDELVSLMIGGRLANQFPSARPLVDGAPTGTLLSVSGLGIAGSQVANISFEVQCGEVLGIAGLAGHGQIDVLEGLAGMRRTIGEVLLHGRRVVLRSPRQALAAGLVLVPEDRKRHGLVMPLSVRKNLTLPVLKKVIRGGFVSDSAENKLVDRTVSAMQVKPKKPELPAGALSGGNQQKVVIGKALLADPQVLLFADPTRGIDVKTKAEIYNLIRELASQGKGVVLVSTDLAEITSLCDRVLVMASGRVVRELSGQQLTEHEVTKASFEAVEA